MNGVVGVGGTNVIGPVGILIVGGIVFMFHYIPLVGGIVVGSIERY